MLNSCVFFADKSHGIFHVNNSETLLYNISKQNLFCNFTYDGGASVHKIVFDSQGGARTPAPEFRGHGQIIGALYPAIKPGYEFLGWFTAPDGGRRAGNDMRIFDSITLYAHWADAAGQSGNREWGYPINFSGNSIHDAITSGFGMRNGGFHAGLDFGASKVSNLDIMAVKDGEVVASHLGGPGTGGAFGEVIVIRHSDGSGYTLCAHLAKRKVSVGDYVTKGQAIGIMGDSGSPNHVHLHFGYYRNWPSESPFSNTRNPASDPTNLWDCNKTWTLDMEGD